MARDTRASDWQFAGILSLGASIGLAAGGWVFTFKSMTAACREDFVMLGAGFGTAGTTLEISLPSFLEGDLSWSPIKSDVPFSAEDLHGAPGVIGTIGASAGLGYSRLYATAFGGESRRCSKPQASVKPPGPLFPTSSKPSGTSIFNSPFGGVQGFVGGSSAGRISSFASPTSRTTTITFPQISVQPEKACPGGSACLFRDQLNDGYGVLADIETQRAAATAADGLLPAVGKAGKRFKPAVSIGAMGVVGMWFGIGNVLTNAMAATGYVAVSVLSGGLVQAGEALISGRGINVMRTFATGYATQLANITSESPEMSDSLYTKLKHCHWKSDLMTYGQRHVDGGSRAPVSSMPEIGFAGEAAILQAVESFVGTRGESAWTAAKQKHRRSCGESSAARKAIYERALWKQIDEGSPVGFKSTSDFMP